MHVDLIWGQRIRFSSETFVKPDSFANDEYRIPVTLYNVYPRSVPTGREVSLQTRFPKVERSSLPRDPDETSVRESAISSSEFHLPVCISRSASDDEWVIDTYVYYIHTYISGYLDNVLKGLCEIAVSVITSANFADLSARLTPKLNSHDRCYAVMYSIFQRPRVVDFLATKRWLVTQRSTLIGSGEK